MQVSRNRSVVRVDDPEEIEAAFREPGARVVVLVDDAALDQMFRMIGAKNPLAKTVRNERIGGVKLNS